MLHQVYRRMNRVTISLIVSLGLVGACAVEDVEPSTNLRFHRATEHAGVDGYALSCDGTVRYVAVGESEQTPIFIMDASGAPIAAGSPEDGELQWDDRPGDPCTDEIIDRLDIDGLDLSDVPLSDEELISFRRMSIYGHCLGMCGDAYDSDGQWETWNDCRAGCGIFQGVPIYW